MDNTPFLKEENLLVDIFVNATYVSSLKAFSTYYYETIIYSSIFGSVFIIFCCFIIGMHVSYEN